MAGKPFHFPDAYREAGYPVKITTFFYSLNRVCICYRGDPSESCVLVIALDETDEDGLQPDQVLQDYLFKHPAELELSVNPIVFEWFPETARINVKYPRPGFGSVKTIAERLNEVITLSDFEYDKTFKNIYLAKAIESKQ